MRDSIRINRNFESLSLRLVSRCLRTATAFLIRCQRSSGMEGARSKHHAFGSELVLSSRVSSRRTIRLEDAKNFVARHKAHLGDTVRVTERNTNLGWREALACELDDVLDDVL